MTIDKIKAYLDSMKSDDPILFDECLNAIMDSCNFWNHKLRQAGMTIIEDAETEKAKEKCDEAVDKQA